MVDYTKQSDIKIEVVWGMDNNDISEYYFESEKEKTAFVDGINESVGWHGSRSLDYVVCGDGYEYSSAEEYLEEQDSE